MKFLNSIKVNAHSIANNAKKNVDVKKIEFTIRGVKKENTLLYAQIGKLVYNCQKSGKPIVTSEIEDLCAQIDGNRLKLAGLENKITEINAKGTVAQADEDMSVEIPPISKNERDLRLVRTDEGVRFMKFCPKCGGSNEPEGEVCVSCGYNFNHKE